MEHRSHPLLLAKYQTPQRSQGLRVGGCVRAHVCVCEKQKHYLKIFTLNSPIYYSVLICMCGYVTAFLHLLR